jgi:hypothetical protein
MAKSLAARVGDARRPAGARLSVEGLRRRVANMLRAADACRGLWPPDPPARSGDEAATGRTPAASNAGAWYAANWGSSPWRYSRAHSAVGARGRWKGSQ